MLRLLRMLVDSMCSVLWQLYLFVALTIAFTGIVHVSVQLLFLVPGD